MNTDKTYKIIIRTTCGNTIVQETKDLTVWEHIESIGFDTTVHVVSEFQYGETEFLINPAQITSISKREMK